MATPAALRLVTWNAHALPWPLATRTGSRIAAMADAIGKAAPDIVLLQEVWTQEASADFVRLLGRIGFTAAAPGALGWGRFTGGLLTLYRAASVAISAAPTFTRYRAKASAFRFWEGDGVSNKGILVTRFQTPIGALAVLNTHMQSQYGLAFGSPRARQPHLRLRSRQFQELRRLSATFGDLPLVVGGDFNTLPEELGQMPIAGWRELTEPLRRECGCGTYLEGDGQWWFDYVFTSALARDWTSQASLIPNQRPDVPFSDHQGLIVDISVPVTAPTPLERGDARRLTRRGILKQIVSQLVGSR